jgi:hypothetical protein
MDLLYERARRLAGGAGVGRSAVECYKTVFEPRTDPAFREWIESRLRSGESAPDPLRDLISAAPERVREWMRRQARLADGTGVGMALVPWSAVMDEIDASAERLRLIAVGADHRACSAVHLATAGLLRDVACLPLARISELSGASLSGCQRRAKRHRGEVLANPAYAIEVADITYRAIRTIR